MKFTGTQAAEIEPPMRPNNFGQALSASASGKICGCPRRTAMQLYGDSTPQFGEPVLGCTQARSRCAREESASSSSIGCTSEIAPMARAITRSASASESAISSASTSWLLKVLRPASERRRVSMPCMVSASRLIMRASPLTSSEPCASQRLSMSPAASACATSPTSWMECWMECAMAQNTSPASDGRDSAPPISHAWSRSPARPLRRARASRRAAAPAHARHRIAQSRFRARRGAARDRRMPRRSRRRVAALRT